MQYSNRALGSFSRIATYACLGRGSVELKGIHVNQGHCNTQIQEAAQSTPVGRSGPLKIGEKNIRWSIRTRRGLYAPKIANLPTLSVFPLFSKNTDRRFIKLCSHQIARPGAGYWPLEPRKQSPVHRAARFGLRLPNTSKFVRPRQLERFRSSN